MKNGLERKASSILVFNKGNTVTMKQSSIDKLIILKKVYFNYLLKLKIQFPTIELYLVNNKDL